MTKTYRSPTVYSLTVMRGAVPYHVRFKPHSWGGSIYSTDDPLIQHALDTSRAFGRDYTADPVEEEETKPKAKPKAVETVAATDPESARDELERRGVPRSATGTLEKIRAAAEGLGIKFEGL